MLTLSRAEVLAGSVRTLASMIGWLAKESNRLKAVERTRLMHSASEERFDCICRLASRLLDTPIAYVSLLDGESQFFKSAVGLGDIRLTPREHSFCTHTVDGSQALYVPDAHHDDRFRENPYVRGYPKVRCYLGEPLFSNDGYAVGTFCILDVRPRELSTDDRELFRDLAALAERELNLLAQIHQHRKLAELNMELLSTLDQQAIGVTLLEALKESICLDRAAVAMTQDGRPHFRAGLGLEGDSASHDLEALHASYSEQSSLLLPILHQQERLGLLWIQRKAEAPFTELEQETAEAFVLHAGLVLENRTILANLFEQSKSASIGALAAGFAHEINSPLGAARLSIESAQMKLKEDTGPVAHKLSVAAEAIERAAAIIRNVLDFSGEGPATASQTDLNQAVRDTLAFLAHDLRQAQVSAEFQGVSGLTVCVSPNELHTMIHHLVKNAIQASGGRPALERAIQLRASTEGQSAKLVVQDWGDGIPPEQRDRVFEPFFTTRPPGQGMGLGLWVCRRLAEQSGGALKLREAPLGTVMQLTLPTA